MATDAFQKFLLDMKAVEDLSPGWNLPPNGYGFGEEAGRFGNMVVSLRTLLLGSSLLVPAVGSGPTNNRVLVFLLHYTPSMHYVTDSYLLPHYHTTDTYYDTLEGILKAPC